MIVKDWFALVSMPPLAVPPSSERLMVTVVEPYASAATVYVNVPALSMAGWLEKRALLSFDTLNVRVWADSLAGPLLIAVAQLLTVCAPGSSLTV